MIWGAAISRAAPAIGLRGMVEVVRMTGERGVLVSLERMQVTIGMDYGFSDTLINRDEVFSWLRDHGVSSVQTYVRWRGLEPQSGTWSYDVFDRDLECLLQYGLKWVPFLIAGPWYATPEWFQASRESVFAQCLEHGQETKTQSIWNPYFLPYVESFLRTFHNHYSDMSPLESIILGVTGDYGEAIYPVVGNWPGAYHSHPGLWCGDRYAVAAFRAYLRKQHSSLTALNGYWGSHFRDWNQVHPFQREAAYSDHAWLDLIAWYRSSMTEWSGHWLESARTVFGNAVDLYLCTGGDMAPNHGSDFTDQAKVAHQYRAGIRITNEASDFLENIALTRLVTTGATYYGGYAGLEPWGPVSASGLVVRMFNAMGTNVRHLHAYAGNLLEVEEGVGQFMPESQRAWDENWRDLVRRVPKYRVALCLSNIDLTLTDRGMGHSGIRSTVEALRPVVDFAVVDEHLVSDRILYDPSIQLVVLAPADTWNPLLVRELIDFVRRGGTVVARGIPRVFGGFADWVGEWTGEQASTQQWSGNVKVQVVPNSSVLSSTELGAWYVGKTVTGLAKHAEILWEGDRRSFGFALDREETPGGTNPQAVLWKVPLGQGASYFYTDDWARTIDGTAQGWSILAALVRTGLPIDAIRWPQALESKSVQYTSDMDDGVQLSLTLDDSPRILRTDR